MGLATSEFSFGGCGTQLMAHDPMTDQGKSEADLDFISDDCAGVQNGHDEHANSTTEPAIDHWQPDSHDRLQSIPSDRTVENNLTEVRQDGPAQAVFNNPDIMSPSY